MMLFVMVGCGGDSSLTQGDEVKETSVFVSVKQYKVVGSQKSNNVNLVIETMKIDVYTADSDTDTDPSDNSLFFTDSFTKIGSKWEISLNGLEREKAYIFVVSAFNSDDADNPIFTGLTSQFIVGETVNSIIISLEQSSSIYNGEFDSIPTASNITVTKDENGKIILLFNIINPNQNSVTWKIFEAGGTNLASEFSTTTGTTAELQTSIELVYTKSVDSSNSNYVLEVKDTNGATSYAFSIDTSNDSEVTVEVNTPPIIKSLSFSFFNTHLMLTPKLDKEPHDVTYEWVITEESIRSNGIVVASFITKNNTYAKSIVISLHPIHDNHSTLLIRLKVINNGVSSYRTYKLKNLEHLDLKKIDTSKAEVRSILGVSKGEADVLLALYFSTNGEAWKRHKNWNTLTAVSSWEGVTVRDGHVIGLSLNNNTLVGALPSHYSTLASLIKLEVLDLSFNKLLGINLKSLGKLKNLKILKLQGNQLIGGIAPELGNLLNLEILNLYKNQFRGEIPTPLANLKKLKHLDLSDNDIGGIIPVKLKKLTNLEELLLNNNQLTGSLPLSFAQLGNLNYLNVSDNPLNAVISDQDFMTFLNALSTFKFNNTELSIQGVTSN
jgi:Leucine-rich repeat (LRR) protein